MITGIINNRGGAIAIGLVAIVLFIALNFGASSLTGARVDLTQDKLFTLSAGTRNILKSLNRSVTLKLLSLIHISEPTRPY